MPAPKRNSNASHRRKLAQEALRMGIDGAKCLKTIEEISEELTMPEPNTAALKARADIQFGLLKKILPDLRHVEMEMANGPIQIQIVRFGESQDSE